MGQTKATAAMLIAGFCVSKHVAFMNEMFWLSQSQNTYIASECEANLWKTRQKQKNKKEMRIKCFSIK